MMPLTMDEFVDANNEAINALHDDFCTEPQNLPESVYLTKAAAVAVLGQERFDRWLANGAKDSGT